MVSRIGSSYGRVLSTVHRPREPREWPKGRLNCGATRDVTMDAATYEAPITPREMRLCACGRSAVRHDVWVPSYPDRGRRGPRNRGWSRLEVRVRGGSQWFLSAPVPWGGREPA